MLGSKDAGVTEVISLDISSRVYPTANLAATFAIGNPVALDAKLRILILLDSFLLQPFFHF